MYKPCPNCNHNQINRAGKDKYGRQKYRCLNCNHHFYTEPHPLGKQPTRFRRTQITDKDIVPNLICPNCNGQRCIDSRYKPTSAGKTKYKCLDCNSVFVVNPLTHKRKVKHKTVDCPNCKNDTAIVKGKNELGSIIYHCTVCQHEFTLSRGRQKTLQVLQMDCPHCHEIGVVKTAKVTTAGNALYKCCTCKKEFAQDKDGNRVVRGNKPITAPLIEGVSCSNCGHDLYHKCGFDHRGNRRYRCKKCSRIFVPNLQVELLLKEL